MVWIRNELDFHLCARERGCSIVNVTPSWRSSSSPHEAPRNPPLLTHSYILQTCRAANAQKRLPSLAKSSPFWCELKQIRARVCSWMSGMSFQKPGCNWVQHELIIRHAFEYLNLECLYNAVLKKCLASVLKSKLHDTVPKYFSIPT